MANKTISNTFVVNTVDDSVVYKIDFGNSVFSYDPNTNRNTIFINGTVYKVVGNDTLVFTQLASSMLSLAFYDANGALVRNVSSADIGVENGTFITRSGNASTPSSPNAEESLLATITIDGVQVARNGLQIFKDGKSAPFYNEEWYAWSNVATTSNVNTSPFTEPYSGWQRYIPEQGSMGYLWKKIVRWNYNTSTKAYIDSSPQYFRMSGTNGTSIHTRGQVANASSRGNNGTATIITDSGTQTITLSDGDAVTQLDNGHLYQWVTEGGGKWLDLGQFKGESGVTYYSHIVWATYVKVSALGLVQRIDGYLAEKDSNDTTHNWMGTYIDENPTDPISGDDPLLLDYTWTNIRGDDAVVYKIKTSVESVKIPSDQTTTSKSITISFTSQTGTETEQAFSTYYSIYYRDSMNAYTLIYPSYKKKDESLSYSFSNISNTKTNIVIFVWGANNSSAYIGQYPEGQNYLVKKEIPILKDGDTGAQGERGNVGRFYYYSGFDWDADNEDDTFVVNDAQVPYFSKAGSNGDKYYVFNREETPSGGSMTMAQMAAETSVGGQIQWNEAPWEVMTDDFKYLITQAIFAQFAKFGSAIISGDWMISQHGTINGVSSTNYTAFNPAHPNDNIETNFIPNYAVDLLTGTTYQHDTHITGGIFVDKVSKVICNTYIWGNNNQWVGTDFDYYLYNATEGEHIYDCDHVGSETVHRDYYSVGKITLKSNFFFILASGIRDKDASAASGSLHIKLPNPKYFIGQSIVITNKSTGFPPNSLLLEQEYVRKNGSGPRHDGQGGSSEHYICTTAKELLLDYPNSQGLGEDGEPVLSNGTYTIIEDDNFKKEYNPTQTGLYSINGIYIANTNIARPTILTELDLNEYEWIELVAVEWNVESQSNILPAIVNEHFSDFYTQWMVTRWEKKATS